MQVKLTNTKTGEVKMVEDTELPGYLGGTQTQTNSPPVNTPSLYEQPKQERFLANTPLDWVGNMGQDIGAGATAMATAPTRYMQNKYMEGSAKAYEDRAYASKNPSEKSFLLRQANEFRQGQGQMARNVSATFSPDVKNNPLLRAFGFATNTALAAQAASSILGSPAIPTLKITTPLGSGVMTGVQGETGLIRQGIGALGNVAKKVIPQNAQTYLAPKNIVKYATKGKMVRASEANAAAVEKVNASDITKEISKILKSVQPESTEELAKIAVRGRKIGGVQTSGIVPKSLLGNAGSLESKTAPITGKNVLDSMRELSNSYPAVWTSPTQLDEPKLAAAKALYRAMSNVMGKLNPAFTESQGAYGFWATPRNIPVISRFVGAPVFGSPAGAVKSAGVTALTGGGALGIGSRLFGK